MHLSRLRPWEGVVVAAVSVFAGGPALAGDGAGSAAPVSFSGYGEMHYSQPSDGAAELDFHRLVLGFAAQLSGDIDFHAELDFEHAFTEPELEFAYVDFFYREEASFRTGVVLMPVGPLNEYHEPPLFYSVERPYVQKHVIPTTWQEPGAGLYGTLDDGALGYRAYVVGGLDASEFTAADGIRGGRQKGAEAKADDLAGVARIEYSPSLRVSFGASGYIGGAAHDDASLGDAVVSIAEADARVAFAGLEARAVAASVFVGDADSVSAHSGEVVGERIVGFYCELAYHAPRHLRRGSEKDLVVFGRYERFDTHDRVPKGLSRDAALEREVLTVGLSFLPVPNVALKGDVELWETGDGADWEQFNLGVGFMY